MKTPNCAKFGGRVSRTRVGPQLAIETQVATNQYEHPRDRGGFPFYLEYKISALDIQTFLFIVSIFRSSKASNLYPLQGKACAKVMDSSELLHSSGRFIDGQRVDRACRSNYGFL